MNKRSNLVIGALMITAGILFLLSNLHYLSFDWNLVWPLALLIPGIYLHFAFFTGIDNNSGILVPAGILTTYGVLFYANIIFGWQIMVTLWPLFLIGVAVGLFELYIFGNKDKGLLIPIFILGGIGGSTLLRGFLVFDLKTYMVPALLILLGLLVIFRKDGFKAKKRK